MVKQANRGNRETGKRTFKDLMSIEDLRGLADRLGKATGEKVSRKEVDFIVSQLGMRKAKEFVQDQLLGTVPKHMRPEGIVKRGESGFEKKLSAKSLLDHVENMRFAQSQGYCGAVRLKRLDGSPMNAIVLLDGPISRGVVLTHYGFFAKFDLSDEYMLFCVFEGDDQHIQARRERGEHIPLTPIEYVSIKSAGGAVSLVKRAVSEALHRIGDKEYRWHDLIPNDDYIWNLKEVEDDYIVRMIEYHGYGKVIDSEEERTEDKKDRVDLDAIDKANYDIEEAARALWGAATT